MNFRRILAPTDFSDCADAALNHALTLADRFDAQLTLVHVIHELDAGEYGLDAEWSSHRLGDEVEAEVRERLRETTADTGSIDIQTEIVHRLNLDVAAAIEEFVADHGIDLVVMGTHGRTGLGRLMLGSVAHRVTRRASCPVLTVRDGSETGGVNGPVDYSEMLAPIDFSEHSRAALRLAKVVAARYEARLHLLFVAERRVLPTFSDTGLPGVSVVEMDPDIVANAEAALEALNENVGGPEVESTYHVTKGEVAQDIVDYAEEQAVDLLTMATRGLAGFSRFLLGSNTDRVVRVAPSPVLTVPAQPESQDN